MKNKTINIALVQQVAAALAELLEQMVFVGGAIVSIYADDPAADDVRPTRDVDMTLNVAGIGEWTRIEERLAQLGFMHRAGENILCRYHYREIIVDIMPADLYAINPPDRWYKEGITHAVTVMPDEGITIRVLPVTYFLAAKFSAYNDRATDARTSKDFEDIVYVTDNCTYLTGEIDKAETGVKTFLKQQYSKIWNSKYRDEFIAAHLAPLVSQARLPLIKEKIERIIA